MDLLDEALQEAERAKKATAPESDLARRQAAEKIWGYVASELNKTFREAGYPVPRGPDAHEARRKWIHEIDLQKGTHFEDRHDDYASLHGDCFYEGKCPIPERLGEQAREARDFVQEVKEAVKEVRRRGAG